MVSDQWMQLIPVWLGAVMGDYQTEHHKPRVIEVMANQSGSRNLSGTWVTELMRVNVYNDDYISEMVM